MKKRVGQNPKKKPGKNRNEEVRTYPMMAKKPHYLFGIAIIVIIAVMVGSFFLIKLSVPTEESIAAEDISSKEKLPLEEIPSSTTDFPSEEAGTLDGWVSLNPQIVTEDVVVLFSSGKIPGLAIVYYPKEKRVVAGMPPLIAENVELLDGKEHNIIYTFQKDGQQAFIVDNTLLAIGTYQPYQQNGITGMAVGVSENIVSEHLNNVEIKNVFDTIHFNTIRLKRQ